MDGPWARVRPPLALVVAVALYAGVFGLRLSIHGTSEAISLLYVFPIALLAVAFGARAGGLAGLAGVALLAVWVVLGGETLTPIGWLSRVTPMLVLGLLVGQATDRLRDRAATERRLVIAALRERQAAEINDSIIQRMSAAKWALEAGDNDRGLELLIESIETAQSLVGDLLHGRDLAGAQRRAVSPTPITRVSRSAG